jgi:hypothetical protein
LTKALPYDTISIENKKRRIKFMKYKGFEINDEKIDAYVENLDISIAEACDLILEEDGKIEESAETTKAIKEAEKNAPRHYEHSATERKKAEKVRKVDETKGFFLNEVNALVEDLGAVVTARKTETEITFTYEGATYTFKLTKHRPPKK